MTPGIAAEALSRVRRGLRLVPVAATLALIIALMVLLGSTYFGHSSSPYGMCYGEDGRAVLCEVAEHMK